MYLIGTGSDGERQHAPARGAPSRRARTRARSRRGAAPRDPRSARRPAGDSRRAPGARSRRRAGTRELPIADCCRSCSRRSQPRGIGGVCARELFEPDARPACVSSRPDGPADRAVVATREALAVDESTSSPVTASSWVSACGRCCVCRGMKSFRVPHACRPTRCNRRRGAHVWQHRWLFRACRPARRSADI